VKLAPKRYSLLVSSTFELDSIQYAISIRNLTYGIDNGGILLLPCLHIGMGYTWVQQLLPATYVRIRTWVQRVLPATYDCIRTWVQQLLPATHVRIHTWVQQVLPATSI
jgi:hypothetical protein